MHEVRPEARQLSPPQQLERGYRVQHPCLLMCPSQPEKKFQDIIIDIYRIFKGGPQTEYLCRSLSLDNYH